MFGLDVMTGGKIHLNSTRGPCITLITITKLGFEQLLVIGFFINLLGNNKNRHKDEIKAFLF
jgi:hypothetical protein